MALSVLPPIHWLRQTFLPAGLGPGWDQLFYTLIFHLSTDPVSILIQLYRFQLMLHKVDYSYTEDKCII